MNFKFEKSNSLLSSLDITSVVVSVVLARKVVDGRVTLDVSGCGSIFHDDRRPVEVDAVIDDEKRVVVVDDIVVDTDTIQVLLQQVLEEEVLLLESSLLLLDSKLIEVNLVVALVEVVKLLEFVVRFLFNTEDFFNFQV